jgi:hypothetical protein
MTPENVGQQFRELYHASWRQNRDSIEERGLRASQPWDDAHEGVYTMPNPHQTVGYGHDIYKITVPADEKLEDDDMEEYAKVITRNVEPDEITRVGHFYDGPRGGETHMHRVEDCRGTDWEEFRIHPRWTRGGKR